MKKFVFLYQGQWEFQPEVMAAWGAWFAKVGDSFVDSGNPFTAARVVTTDGVRDLDSADEPSSGYSIVSAEDMDAAIALLEGCPIVESVRVYEATPM